MAECMNVYFFYRSSAAFLVVERDIIATNLFEEQTSAKKCEKINRK